MLRGLSGRLFGRSVMKMIEVSGISSAKVQFIMHHEQIKSKKVV